MQLSERSERHVQFLRKWEEHYIVQICALSNFNCLWPPVMPSGSRLYPTQKTVSGANFRFGTVSTSRLYPMLFSVLARSNDLSL